MKYTFSGRYSEILQDLLDELGAKKELMVDFEDDWQGHVAIDALLKDGRVFVYKYWYGSCSGCDDWEDRELNDDEIKKEMLTEATVFDNLELYKKYKEMQTK